MLKIYYTNKIKIDNKIFIKIQQNIKNGKEKNKNKTISGLY